MKRIILFSGLVLIALPGMAQNRSASGPITATAAKAPPHYPKSATETTLKTWVHKYPAEARNYQEALVNKMSTTTPDSKPYSDAKAEFARISPIVTAESQSNPGAAQSAAGIKPPAPGLTISTR